MPVAAQTAGANRLDRRLQDRLSEATRARIKTTDLEDRALARALQAALDAYDEVNQLIDWMIRQITIDGKEYDHTLEETLTALHTARTAIQQAEAAVNQSDDASGARRQALHRSRAVLRLIDVDEQDTREALARARRQAEAAYHYAKRAEHPARPAEPT